MRQISYKQHRFPPQVIRQPVWLYYRFTLSLRDVEDVLAERGIADLPESFPVSRRVNTPNNIDDSLVVPLPA